MNILTRRMFCQSAVVHGISVSSQCFSRRWYSSTTRQEFGRLFEEVVAQSLRKYSFDVAVCGGPKDRGVDFRGVWLLKSSFVRVVGQCRRYKKRLGPKHIRELEGTLTHEVKGTLGIVVTECGYSKDAYEVFMGSTFPIALTTLKGYSDELLHWYFDKGNDKTCGSKNQDITDERESAHNVQYKSTEVHLPRDTQIVDSHDSNVLGKNNKDVFDTREVKNLQQYSTAVQDEAESSFNHKRIRDDDSNATDSNISWESDQCDTLRIMVDNDDPLANDFADIDASDNGQFTNANISEAGVGVFTMFELNPAARKLLPNLVVGLKYIRPKSKTPELFINEDDSFVTLPK